MAARFYVPHALEPESVIELPEDEAAHLTRVLRLTRGAAIRVFNGRGDEWDAEVDAIEKRHVAVRLHGAVTPAAEPRVRLTLAAAVLKGDKMDDVVRDAVMLGAAAVTPMLTTRTETSRTMIDRRGRVARWQRIAVASAKQCGRAVVPDVRSVATFDELIPTSAAAVMMVEPSASSHAQSLRDLRVPAGGGTESITLFVGPEGGWTEQEVQTARAAGAMLLMLGAQTLRADAVPLVALTALRVRLEDF